MDKLTLPVAYDLEEYSDLTGEQLVEIAETFCTAVQDAGLNAMVYANGNFYSKMDLSSPDGYGGGLLVCLVSYGAGSEYDPYHPRHVQQAEYLAVQLFLRGAGCAGFGENGY